MADTEEPRVRTDEAARGIVAGALVGIVLFILTSVLSEVGLTSKLIASALLAGAAFLAVVWWTSEPSPWWRHWRAVPVAALVLAAGVLTILGLGAVPPAPWPCVREPIRSASIDGSVDVDNLSAGQRVEASELVVGSYDGLAADIDLWMVLYAPRADRFYPQSHREFGPAELHGGRFESRMTFAGGAGESYQVMAVATTLEASASLSRTLAAWERDGNAPGFTRAELPGGLDEHDCVPVVLAHAPPTTTSSTSTTSTTSTSTTTTTTTTTTTAPPLTFPLEVERFAGAGENKDRSAASNEQSRWLQAGESATAIFAVAAPGSYPVVVAYSNDNFGALETVSISIDGDAVGSFVAQDTGDFGEGWNVFATSPALGPVTLAGGAHQLTISVTGGDGNGVEVDVVRN